MRTQHDQIAKQLLQAILEPVGPVRLEEEVSGEVQRADVCFTPDPERREERLRLGLLGRLASAPCLLEPYRKTPGLDTVLDCVDKLLTWRRSRRAPASERPRLWILSTGMPRTAIRELGLRAAPGWPTGVYHAAPGWRTGIVVLSELARDRPNLSLRLLGSGKTQRQAISELVALPSSDQERLLLLKPLMRLRFEIPPEPGVRTPQQEEFLVNSQELLQAFEEELLRKGHEKGLEEGLEKGLQEGRQEGRLEEARAVLHRLATRRFGAWPAWLEKWSAAQTAPEEVERAAEELLDARTPAALKKRLQT
jgi:hypothetical protein